MKVEDDNVFLGIVKKLGIKKKRKIMCLIVMFLFIMKILAIALFCKIKRPII
jgi:hypothetical protein